MTDETENMVLEMLRPIRSSQERMELYLIDVKGRVSAIEQMQGQMLNLLGGLGVRMDRFEERLSRVERRLELVDLH